MRRQERFRLLFLDKRSAMRGGAQYSTVDGPLFVRDIRWARRGTVSFEPILRRPIRLHAALSLVCST